jgi:adenylylsulfate kinase-like enzyme
MKISNIFYHKATVTREMHNQLNKNKSVVIWFTALSGSGKSTLAHSVEEKLYKLSCRKQVLDVFSINSIHLSQEFAKSLHAEKKKHSSSWFEFRV